jgi:beta-galactosidase
VFREVRELGGHLKKLGVAQGSRVTADVAVLYDWESLWAQDLEWRPSDDAQFRERMRTYYERLWHDGVTVDFAHPTHDLSGYKLVVAPASYLLTTEAGDNLAQYVESGGTLLVSHFAGVVDEFEAVHAGGYGAPLRRALGLTVEEFLPLRESESCAVEFGDFSMTTDVWAEELILDGAEVRGTYRGGPASDSPAITRNSLGAGAGWYVSTHLGVDELAPVMDAVYEDAGIVAPRHPHGLEVVTRQGDDADYTVALNHTDAPLTLSAEGTDLLTGLRADGEITIPAGGSAVLRATKSSEGGVSLT